MPIVIRPARVGDVVRLAEILNDYAEQRLMLHRSHAELYERIRDFKVAADAEDQVVGVVGLRIMWANLAELYALAVTRDMQGKGLGRRLVLDAVDEAEQLGIRNVFSLTYERHFFERCGFEVVDRHQKLPLKVWSECVRCPKNQACDEIAMLRVLESVPEVTPINGEPLTPDIAARYDVPIMSEVALRIDSSARRGPAATPTAP
jgi:amino-acid N-acetyltransferase